MVKAEQLFLKGKGVKKLVVERPPFDQPRKLKREEKKHPMSVEESEMRKILMFLVVPAILAGFLAVAYATDDTQQAPRSDEQQAPRSAAIR